MACTVVWFRRDLRLSDHAALSQASRRGAVLPVFVLDRDLLFHPETWLTDTSARSVGTERVSVDWVGREP